MDTEGSLIKRIKINHEEGEYLSLLPMKSLTQHFGGTAGNIGYNFGLLNLGKIYLIGSVGKDFESLGYRNHINQFKNFNLKVKVHNDAYTARCYIINDSYSNQIVIFHEGAQEKFYKLDLKKMIESPEDILIAIDSTQNLEAMIYFAEKLYELKIPMIFDPGQKISSFSKKSLLNLIIKSEILISNNFEID